MLKLFAALMLMPILALSGQQPVASDRTKSAEAMPDPALASPHTQPQIASTHFIAPRTIGLVSTH